MIGLSGCVTRYHSSAIDLEPAYISEETIEYCEECPPYVQEDLARCQANAAKQDFRNDLDDAMVTEDVTDKLLSIAGTLWDWI